MKRFCDSYANEKTLLPLSHLLSSSPFSQFFFFLSCGPLLIHTYILLPAANRVVFSNSYSAHGMLFLSFLASLSPLAFSRSMYTFVGLVTHYSCRLGLMVFFTIFTVNSL